jgi:hypothetical protein
MIEAGLNASADAFARNAEGEHVADLKAGADTIQKAGAVAERAQQQQKYMTQSDCELKSSTVVTAAIRAAREAVSNPGGHRDFPHRRPVKLLHSVAARTGG